MRRKRVSLFDWILIMVNLCEDRSYLEGDTREINVTWGGLRRRIQLFALKYCIVFQMLDKMPHVSSWDELIFDCHLNSISHQGLLKWGIIYLTAIFVVLCWIIWLICEIWTKNGFFWYPRLLIWPWILWMARKRLKRFQFTRMNFPQIYLAILRKVVQICDSFF